MSTRLHLPLSLFLSILLVLPTLAAPEVKLPTEIKGKPGEFLRVPVLESTGEVRWYSVDPGLSLFPAELLRDSKVAVAVAMRPGRYRLLAWTAEGGVPSNAAECVLVIGDAPPPPPVPPPVPNDPLARAVQQAWTAETAADREKHRSLLAGLYRAAAGDVRTATQTKVFDFFRATQTARRSLIGEGLPAVRAAITDELDKTLPRNVDAPLDAATRDLCSKTFARVAAALEAIK